jgi:predicted RNA-binding Zn ribbon-like protein
MENSPLSSHHGHAVDLDDTFDFLNTKNLDDGFAVDHLTGFDDAIRWFVERDVLHAETAERLRADVTAKPASATPALKHVRAVRDALREIADAVVQRRPPTTRAIDRVNRALHARQIIELAPSADGVIVGHEHVGDPLDDALARLAEPLVLELASGHPERVRICASDTCRWVFYDTSRTGRRRWCDMASCGNRAKQARHRARHRAEGVGADGAADA